MDLFCDGVISSCKQLVRTINNSDTGTCCVDSEGEIDGT